MILEDTTEASLLMSYYSVSHDIAMYKHIKPSCAKVKSMSKFCTLRTFFFFFHLELSAASRWICLDAVWHTWFPLRVWLGQVKRPDVTSNPLVLPPSESPRNPQSSLGFSGYKPSFVCPLQHQAQPWCHGYLKGFNWPTIITHSFKKQPPLEEIFLCCSLGLSTFLPIPEPPNPNRTWSHTAGVFFFFFPESISSLLFGNSGEQWCPL